MENKEILGFAIERASAVNTYWNIFIAVATTIVGVMTSEKAFTNNLALKISLTGAFVVFAYSNLKAIVRLGELREALLTMLSTDLPNREAVVKSLSPAKWWQYTGFHLFLDVIVLAVMWIAPYFTR